MMKCGLPSPDRSGTRPLIVLDVMRMTSQDAAHRSITCSPPIYHPAPGESPVTTLAYRFAVNSVAPNGTPRRRSPGTAIRRPNPLSDVSFVVSSGRCTQRSRCVRFGLIDYIFIGENLISKTLSVPEHISELLTLQASLPLILQHPPLKWPEKKQLRN